MLVLVLDDHPVDEPGVEERLLVELDGVERVEHPVPDVGHVRQRLVRPEELQSGPIAASVGEGVVDLVQVGCHPGPAHGPEEPLLLVVPDVGKVPHEGRHQR